MNARRSPIERARLAERMWQAYSGRRLGGDAIEDQGGAELRVIRLAAPGEIEYPSLVDPSLLWLTLGVTAPSESIALLRWRADGSVSAEIDDLGLPAEARPGFERAAQAIVFDAGRVEPPRIDFMDVGRGAWEQAANHAEPTACSACPFALASNLDCPVCRQVVLGRKTFSSWSRARVAEGLRALDFEPHLASRVALETELALRHVRAPMLSRVYFDEFARRFELATRSVFAVDEDLLIGRDLIEAQMVQPWFKDPPLAENVQPLPLPPPLPDEHLGATARRKVRELVEAGVPRWQAERRVEASLTLRRLLAAEGELLVRELGAGEVQIHGSLDRIYLMITDDEGEPWIVEVATPIAREVEVQRGLSDDERARLHRTIDGVHRRLMDAVAHERRLLDEPDDQRALDLAMENLRDVEQGGRSTGGA